MPNLITFNPLTTQEIDFRIQSITSKGYATILAYKDARVDMNKLDETFGVTGWQKDYKVINDNLFCGIGIYDKEKQQWIWKWDVGVESMTEKEKGEASDAFKRACFNLGIGRELYDYPFIQVQLNADEFVLDGAKAKQTYNLRLKDWKWVSEFKEKQLISLSATDNKGVQRFNWSIDSGTQKISQPTQGDINLAYVFTSFYKKEDTEKQNIEKSDKWRQVKLNKEQTEECGFTWGEYEEKSKVKYAFELLDHTLLESTLNILTKLKKSKLPVDLKN